MAPSTSKDYLMTVRLDILDEVSDKAKLLEWLSKFQVFVVYREISDKVKKPHYQGYVACGNLEASKIAKSEFHVMYKDTHKPGQRSFNQVKKVESYMRYVAKDKDLVASSGVTDAELKKLEAESFKTLQKSGNLVERCHEWAKDNGADDHAVARWLLNDCIDRRTRIDVRHLRCVKHTVMAMISGDYFDMLERELCANF